VWNLWKTPSHRRIFEEKLVDALRSVREASSLSGSICPSSGIFFETTLASTVDLTALYSLRIKDLFAYSNILIRVRCCSLLSHSATTLIEDEDLSQPRPLSGIERVARCSLGGSLSALPQQASIVQRRHRSSFTSLLQRKWQSDEAVVLFEASLADFMDGTVILREVFSRTAALREVASALRLRLSYETSDRWASGDLSSLISTAAAIIEATLGPEKRWTFSNLFSKHSEEGDLVYRNICRFVEEAVVSVGLNGSLVTKMFNHFRGSGAKDVGFASLATSALSSSVALLEALEACLHEAVVNCFDSPDVLRCQDLQQDTIDSGERQSGGSGSISGAEGLRPESIREIMVTLNSISHLKSEREKLLARHQHPDMSQHGHYDTPSPYASAYQSEYIATSASIEHSTREDWNEASDSTMIQADGGDWVTYLDEASGKYYSYSASTNESKWID
jgi:hypothetical protein